MKPVVVNCKTFYYLPWRIIMGVVVCGGGVGLILAEKYIPGAIVVLLGLMVFTAHYGISINTAKRTYVDYLSILWIKTGEEQSYGEIDYVFIKTSLVSQNMNSLATSRSFKSQLYDGYIKFDGSEKVFLLSNEKKAKVLAKLEFLATALEIGIVDHTTATVREPD